MRNSTRLPRPCHSSISPFKGAAGCYLVCRFFSSKHPLLQELTSIPPESIQTLQRRHLPHSMGAIWCASFGSQKWAVIHRQGSRVDKDVSTLQTERSSAKACPSRLTSISEPGTLGLLATGLVSVGLVFRRWPETRVIGAVALRTEASPLRPPRASPGSSTGCDTSTFQH